MTFAPLATFLSTRGSIIVRHGCPGVWSPTETTTAGRTALSAALYQGPGKLMDYSGVAISFFTSIRIPAALVAGSSLATMFANPDPGRSSRLENRVMVLYHMCALLGFLLSLNVVLTSTSTTTVLLLGMKNPLAHSAYELLRRELDYEFTSTRWSFFMALFSFITSVSGRVLVEFCLLRPQRWRTAILVVSAILSLAFHLLSVANRSLHCWPHLGAMTVDLCRLLWNQARNYPMEALSVALGVMAFGFGAWACVITKGFADFDLLEETKENDDEEEDARMLFEQTDDL